LNNIEFTHDFVINVVDESLLRQVVKTSSEYPSDVDELKEVGLTAIKSEKVKSPRVAESKVSLECRLVQKLELLEEKKEGKGLRAVVFGEVVLVHVKDEVWVDGKIDPSRLGAVGRLGSEMYYGNAGIFSLQRSS
jgi:flavin reductase (DIM6/NTAB) family NADH-FMN oxidoreductase RutF